MNLQPFFRRIAHCCNQGCTHRYCKNVRQKNLKQVVFKRTNLWMQVFVFVAFSLGLNLNSSGILNYSAVNFFPERNESIKAENVTNLTCSIPEVPECSYAEFFRQIIAFINGSIKNVPTNSCFIVHNYDESGNAPDYGKYTKRIAFYCQYGYSGTPNGETCYGELFMKFRDFLGKSGYSLILKEDHSMTGWINKLYSAGKNGRQFLFVYESESAASMGYAKITIVK
jgi:hypothetical protein